MVMTRKKVRRIPNESAAQSANKSVPRFRTATTAEVDAYLRIWRDTTPFHWIRAINVHEHATRTILVPNLYLDVVCGFCVVSKISDVRHKTASFHEERKTKKMRDGGHLRTHIGA